MFKRFLKGSVSGNPLLAAADRVAQYLKPVASGQGIGFAEAMELAVQKKMTGPRAQVPSYAAVRNTALRIMRGKSTVGSWRSWPKEKAL